MKKARSMLFAAVVMLALAGVVPAHAQSASACTFTATVTLAPGDSPTPRPGTFTTRDPVTHVLETGSVSCQGTLLNGNGTIGYEGTYGDVGPGDNCAEGSGSGLFSYTIGSRHLEGTFQFVRAALVGGFSGATHYYSDNANFSGVFEFMPASGQDCVTKDVTSATVTGQAVVSAVSTPY